MSRRTKMALGILGLGMILALAPVRSVTGDEMSPTIRDGDVVWVVPGLEVLRGDVVAVTDPLDPSRVVLRRAIAPGGTEVHFTDDGVRVDAKRLRIRDMGTAGAYGVYQEILWSKPPARAVKWLTRRVRKPAVHWEAEPVEVPSGHWYLLADDRDDALDSRWWGPVPVASIRGVVRLRYGPADLWRTRLAMLRGAE